MAPPVCPANAHGQLLCFVISFFYRDDRTKTLQRAIRNSWRRCLFRLFSWMMFVVLVRRKRRRWKIHKWMDRIGYVKKLWLSSMSLIRIAVLRLKRNKISWRCAIRLRNFKSQGSAGLKCSHWFAVLFALHWSLINPDSYRDGNGRKSLPVCFSFVLSFAQAKERT